METIVSVRLLLHFHNERCQWLCSLLVSTLLEHHSVGWPVYFFELCLLGPLGTTP